MKNLYAAHINWIESIIFIWKDNFKSLMRLIFNRSRSKNLLNEKLKIKKLTVNIEVERPDMYMHAGFTPMPSLKLTKSSKKWLKKYKPKTSQVYIPAYDKEWCLNCSKNWHHSMGEEPFARTIWPLLVPVYLCKSSESNAQSISSFDAGIVSGHWWGSWVCTQTTCD